MQEAVDIRRLLHMIGRGALNRDIGLAAQSGFPSGLFPPLGVLKVQFASDLFRPPRLDADHHLILKLGRLAGEDVDNGATVRLVHPKRVALCHAGILLVFGLDECRPGQAFMTTKTEASTATIQSVTHTFKASGPYEGSADATSVPTVPFAPVRPVATASGILVPSLPKA